MRRVLGSPDPENEPPTAPFADALKLVSDATENTYMAPLAPEIMYALGYTDLEVPMGHIDTMIISARHGPEEILWNLADHFAIQRGQEVAVINPVGHYKDVEARVLGPRKLFHTVDTAVFLTSTQHMYGGSMSVLIDTMSLLRNEDFTSKINKVAIVIPMFGGSRGHRPGQAKEIGYEVLQADTIPKSLSAIANDILADPRLQKIANLPQISFYSVDIHNKDLPGSTFESRDFEFISIGPESQFAQAIRREINEQMLYGTPIRLVAVDGGALERTEALAAQILLQGANGYRTIDIIEIEKHRITAGEVASAEVKSVIRMSLDGGKIETERLDINALDLKEEFIRVTSDDMLDTGKSAKKDDVLLDQIMPRSVLKISVVTHPIVSEGLSPALDNTGSDVVIVGNTLTNPELYRDHKHRVRVVDLAPAIGDSLFAQIS